MDNNANPIYFSEEDFKLSAPGWMTFVQVCVLIIAAGFILLFFGIDPTDVITGAIATLITAAVQRLKGVDAFKELRVTEATLEKLQKLTEENLDTILKRFFPGEENIHWRTKIRDLINRPVNWP